MVGGAAESGKYHGVGAARGGEVPVSGVGDGAVDLSSGSPAWRTVSSGPGVRAVKSEISRGV